jgi:hypothetical protein
MNELKNVFPNIEGKNDNNNTSIIVLFMYITATANDTKRFS